MGELVSSRLLRLQPPRHPLLQGVLRPSLPGRLRLRVKLPKTRRRLDDTGLNSCTKTMRKGRRKRDGRFLLRCKILGCGCKYLWRCGWISCCMATEETWFNDVYSNNNSMPYDCKKTSSPDFIRLSTFVVNKLCERFNFPNQAQHDGLLVDVYRWFNI